MFGAMSVPAWKQAIFDRRKKQEDEQKRKQAEEEAYLATLPPWKRALFQKREKERRQQQQEKEKAAGGSCERSDSFLQCQQQLAQEREQRTSSWGRRATPPSDSPTSPTSPPYGSAHHFFFSAPSTQQPSQGPTTTPNRRTSITTLPGIDEITAPIAEKVANAPIPHSTIPTRRSSITTLPEVNEITAPPADKVSNAPPVPHSTWKNRPRSASSNAALEKKVVSSMKKFDDVTLQSTEMPAWKKALLQRRKEKEMKSTEARQKQVTSPTEPVPPVPLPVNRNESPEKDFDKDALQKEDGKDKHVNASLPVMKRTPSPEVVMKKTPSPENTATVVKGSSLHLQRKSPPPIEQVVPNRSQTPEVIPKSTRIMKYRSAPDLTSESLTGKKDKVTEKSHDNNTATVSNKVQRNTHPTPKRSAPEAPPSSKTQSQTVASSKPSQTQNRAPSSQPPVQHKPVPEVVNRSRSEPPQQNQTIQTEGIAHRAPVFKEVGEWANVPEDDPKFLSLPTWKQALIKRRRADIAKRMGLTTSVDDVLLTNGPVTNNEHKTVKRTTPDPISPPWKLQTMAEESTNTASSYEKKHLANKHSPPNSSSNIRALLDRFSDKSTPPAAPPVITVSHPRSPSPSSQNTRTGTPPTIPSRPAYSSFGLPEMPSTHSSKTTSLTWTPGEGILQDESLSDDSSEDEGDYTVTNIDDTSSEEESGSDSTPAVVLLKPPQALPSLNQTAKRERKNSLDSSHPIKKKNSILVDFNRPKKRVSVRDPNAVCNVFVVQTCTF